MTANVPAIILGIKMLRGEPFWVDFQLYILGG